MTTECDVCGTPLTKLPSSGEHMDGLVLDFYACEHCHEGGHVARTPDDGSEIRREGPVFDASRYRNGQITRDELRWRTEATADV